MSAADKTLRRWRPALVVGIGLILVTVLIWVAIKEFVVADKGKKKRVIQEISLVRPPPPPPPPPPKKIEAPPKQEIPQKVDVPKPDQPPDKPPDAQPPDAGIPEGPAGGMATDIAVGSGSGIIGGGGLGNRFAWYGALVKERIQEAVARDKKLREADYRIMVSVWINASGTVTRADLISSTGDVELDSALKVALRNLPPVREGAPNDMPQPIKLRITAH